MFRSAVTALVVEPLVPVGENLSGAVALAFWTPAVGAEGFFCVIKERAFQAVDQTIIQMQTDRGQSCFDLL